MKGRVISAIILVHSLLVSFSQQVTFSNYDINTIPENLKKDANAVYRLDEGILDITSPSTYTLQVHQITTILDKEGAPHLQQSFAFDKFYKVGNVEVNVYNSLGIKVQQYKKKDFAVQNYYDGFSLAKDDKMMRLGVAAPGFPCTIEVSYIIEASGYIELPNWYVSNYSSSVEQFRYTVKVPADLDIRYNTVNMAVKPEIEENGKTKIYTWDTKNIPVNKVEQGGYEGSSYLPQIKISPNLFEYDGYKGVFKTWGDFGKWNYDLYEEKKPFTDQRIADIKAMVTGLTDVKNIVAVLYSYLQENMRYVSIQFGIGGYKPFAVRMVDEKKYGDCKALTNYMRNLLAVVGIKSYPALINAGYNKAPAREDFPESIFNHVILCIPNQKDSIWLECTSSNHEAGYLGSFTENKKALLLTENGGILVQTPRSNYQQNVLNTVHEIQLDEDGGAIVKGKISGSGSFHELLSEIDKMETDKQKEGFMQYFDYKQPENFQLTTAENSDKKSPANFQMAYDKLYDFKAGAKFFFPKTLQSICNEKLELNSGRKIEYLFHFPYTKVDTTVFYLSGSFAIDNLPPVKEITSGPVYYKREIALDSAANKITITSILLLKSNIIQPAQYLTIAQLFRDIEKEENDKLILSRKEATAAKQ